ncbi:hypothetical protein [Fulvivirga ligni]|uniref:hypothetical protein n=1 Tax=Fulvivirga ligni TaxID=2904246 RepID=UPI001F46B268|nr:hypothetical protein [Fulvivirga ligni]UII22525.1 hypothetical protein LVD16_04700 [Fulvivirga ligni]
MMKLIFNCLALLLCISFVAKANSGTDHKSTKKIQKAYDMPANGYLEVFNKYGQVVISTWEKDSVQVNITITGFGKDEEDAQKMLDRVDIDFNKTGQYLTMETLLDRKSGFFKEVWNNINDYSKTILSKNKLEIDYEIFMPATMHLELDNKFGDVYLQELSGQCDIKIMHGNLRANRINAYSQIDIGYGDIRIKEFKKGRLTLKSVEGEIKKLGQVDLQSSSSALIIEEAENIIIDSRSDRKLVFQNLNSIKGKSTFSEIEIEELQKTADLNLTYGYMSIKSIPFSFNKINVESRYTDINLAFYPNSYLKIDITGREEDIRLPKENAKTKTDYLDEKKRDVRITGEIGDKSNYPGELFIKSAGGEINLSLSSLKQSANN